MIAGLDLGTSTCKLSVYDGGRLVVQTSAVYTATRSRGRHSLNADTVWECVKSLFHQAISKNRATADIRALAVSSLGEAAVPVDSSGKTLGEALLFWDPSGKDEMREIADKIGVDTIADITGVIPDPMFTLCKIAWQKKNTAYYGATKYFLLFEDFIIYRLTGQRKISYSLACRTMGFDIKAKEWSSVMFEAAGVDPALMSKPVASGTPAGTVLPEVKKELGLLADTLVTTGGHDQMCVAVGAGATTPGIASNGSGTVEVMAITISNEVAAKVLYANNFTLSVHAAPCDLFTYSCNSTGTLLLNWYTCAFGDPASATPFSDFESRAPVEPTSLIMLPYIAGSGTPFMDMGAKGGILGLDYATTKYEIYRALMEGLTYDLACNMDRMALAGVGVSELRCTGGGSLSKMWLQIKADVTGIPVYTLENHQAGTLGCMMLAAVAAGEYTDIRQAVTDQVKTKDIYEPNQKNHQFYQDQKGRFMEISKKTRPYVIERL